VSDDSAPVPTDPGKGNRVELRDTVPAGLVNSFERVDGNVTVNNLVLPAPGAPGAPHQTPAIDGCLYGRTAELDMIDEMVLNTVDGAVRIIILSGTPGIGRRTTARQWAHRTALARLFPGGEINVDFVDYQDRDRPGTGVADALISVLGELGADPQWPSSSIDALAGRYRSLTFEREPMLVLLEGATSAAQVRPLVPNRAGSVVVVAGDRELPDLVALGGAMLIRLEPLSPEAGVTVLSCLCRDGRIAADPAASNRLVTLCGGLPLALRLAAARLVVEPFLSVSGYVAELEDEAARLMGLSAAGESLLGLQLDRAVERLPPAARELYCALGLVPVRAFTAQLAASAIDIPQREAAAGLRALRDNSLLLQDAAGRFRFHDLVRLHARGFAGRGGDLAVRDPASAVLHRLVDFLLPQVAFADRAVTGSRARAFDQQALVAGHVDRFGGEPAPKAAALAWLDSERGNLLALLRAAEQDGGLDVQSAQLAEMLTALFLNRRYLHDWIESGRLGAQAAARIGDAVAEARLRSLVSRPLADLGDLQGARLEIERAVSLVEGGETSVIQASVWEFYGRHLSIVRPEAAGAAYARSLELNDALGESRGAALVEFFLGENLESLGRLDEALEALTRARSAFEELSDARMAARARLAIGRVHAGLGDGERASAMLASAAESLAAQGAAYYEAQARDLLGSLLVDRGERDAGCTQLELALAVYAASGDPHAGDLRDRLERAGWPRGGG
jgi:tetratricopeptide (TPR) repeat protein